MGLFDAFKKKKSPDKDLTPMQAMAMTLFPNGHKDIVDGGNTVHQLAKKKIPSEQSQKLFAAIKSLIFISESISSEEIRAKIDRDTNGVLSQGEIQSIYLFISGDSDGSSYSGGDGASADKAVVINCTASSKGISAEYAYLEQHFGRRDQDWTLTSQMQLNSDGKNLDALEIRFPSGETRTIYFDISQFYGRF